MRDRTAILLLVISLFCLVLWGVIRLLPADAQESLLFPRYTVECDEGTCIRVDVLTGSTWALATPGAVTSWEWEALEVRDGE